jgi:endo-1,4-beta-mannosidase
MLIQQIKHEKVLNSLESVESNTLKWLESDNTYRIGFNTYVFRVYRPYCVWQPCFLVVFQVGRFFRHVVSTEYTISSHFFLSGSRSC